MTAFAEMKTHDMRLVLLRALETDAGYSLNESILHTIAVEFGHTCSRDHIKAQLSWLQEQGLLVIKEVAGYYIATLTQRGADVATGCTTVPGVKRPSPRGC